MEIQSFIFRTYYLVNILKISWAYGASIQLYEHQNFTGLLWQGNSTKECTNIHTSFHTEVHSIRTSACFIAYEHSHCKSRWSMKILPGDINLSQNKITYIFSFHTCDDKEGGNQLNVDVTNYHTWNIFGSPEVVQSYKNVCSCVNVPKYLRNMKKWSINNHHNALLVYYEPDCSENKWNSKLIAAGNSYSSKYMHYHKQTDPVTKIMYQTQSFGPDPNSPYFRKSCHISNTTTKSLQSVGFHERGNYESSIKSVTSNIDDVKGHIQIISDKVWELQTQFDQSKQNQDKFYNDFVSALNQRNANLKKLNEKIKEFQRNAESSLLKLTLTCKKCVCN